MKLDIGSDAGRYQDYTTVDLHAPEADVRASVEKLPFPNDSVTDIWCSHMLEHLLPGQVQPALKEMLRVLTPGGRAVVVIPDLDDACRRWLARDPSAQGEIFGQCNKPGQAHHIGWGARELHHELTASGFQVVALQSVIESAESNLGGSYYHRCVNLVAELRKPHERAEKRIAA